MITGIIVFLVAGGGYFGYTKIFGNNNAVSYATAKVQKGTLIVSITGSGQVSASNQVDIKPKAAGKDISALETDLVLPMPKKKLVTHGKQLAERHSEKRMKT